MSAAPIREKRRKSLSEIEKRELSAEVVRLELEGTPRTVYYTLRALVRQGHRFKLEYGALARRLKADRADLFVAIRKLRDVGLIRPVNQRLAAGEIPEGEEVSLG